MFEKFATEKFRWLALVFLALGLAIVIIDNSVLNVAIPYILRDLNTSLDRIEWVISGYALIIATLLITTGRLGDLFGRKKVFLLGTVFFAIGSFVASIAPNIQILFLGESIVEAIGAAMMLTSTLSLIASEFHGRERALAFGVWGAVAGASASIGPLLGGYLTAYHSWRWSLRINVVVALIAILGSIFIQESKGEDGKKFDLWGTLLSGAGLFSLVFALIEGQKFGWWKPAKDFVLLEWHWPFNSISITPFAFLLAILLLAGFVFIEVNIERRGGSPLLKPSMFKNFGLVTALATVGILSLGQLGSFFIFPIFLQNVVGYNAFQSGLVFLPATISSFLLGAFSGFVASKIGPKWIVSVGMFILAAAIFLTFWTLTTNTTGWTLAPFFVLFGVGVGMAGAQLTNLVLSSVPVSLAGEASGANATMRQVGASIGIAVIGAVLTSTLNTKIAANIRDDSFIPSVAKERIISSAETSSTQLNQQGQVGNFSQSVTNAVEADVKAAIASASKGAVGVAGIFVLLGAFASLLIPAQKEIHTAERPPRPAKNPVEDLT